MLIPLKAIISPKTRKDGTSIIFFQYCYSSTNRTLLNMELAIPRTYWNAKRQCVSKLLPPDIGSFEKLNNEIARIKKIIERIIEHGTQHEVPDKGAYVKELFKLDFDIQTLETKAVSQQVSVILVSSCVFAIVVLVTFPASTVGLCNHHSI